MSSTATSQKKIFEIPTYEKGPAAAPYCIKNPERGDSMVFSSPEEGLNDCFLCRHKIVRGQTRGGGQVSASLKEGTKYIFLVEGCAKILLATDIKNGKALKVQSYDMRAPSYFKANPGDAFILVPETNGEFVEYSPAPHKLLFENTSRVDFGEQVTQVLAEPGCKS
jgi:hypothetical protein